MTTNKKGDFGPTVRVYLQLFEQMSEAQIARALGVRRQRIHQLEERFGVCQMAPDGRRKPPDPRLICPKCGGPKARQGAVCRKCFSASTRARWPRFICPACGEEFARRQANVHVEEPACSHRCSTRWQRSKRA